MESPRPHAKAGRARSDAFPKKGVVVARAAGYLIVVAAVLAVLYGRIDMHAVHAYAARLNAGVAFALLVVLPLLGFPASVLHVAAGVRFGAVLGLTLVSLSIGLQLLASYALVHRWRDRFARRFGWVRRRIPRGAHASLTVFTVLLPGVPFAAVNYALPLIGIRLRTYLMCLWPLHTLRASLTVLLGGESDTFTPVRLLILGAYALLLGTAAWVTYRRLRRQLEDRPAAADDQMQPV